MKSKITFILNLFKSKHVLSLASTGVNGIIGLLTISILLRFLTKEDMGNWMFFLTVLLLVDTIRSGFLSTSFVKFYSGSSPDRQNEVIGSAWYIAIGITLFFVILNIPAYFVSLYVKDPSITLFLRFFSINYVLSLPFFVANCILQGKQRFDKLLILNFSNQGSFLTLLLIVIFLKHINIHTVLYCYLSANLISSTIALLSGWTSVSKLKFKTKDAVREIYNFGKFSVGTNLSATLLGSVDTFLIKAFLGPAALAVYSTGNKLIQVVEIPLRSFVFTAMPSLSASYNSGEKTDVISLMKKYIGILSIILFPVGIGAFIFADFAILILGGEKYVATEAPNLLRVFMLIAMFSPAERFFALTLDVIHMPKINFMKVVLMLVITAVIDYIAIRLTGNIYGIAISSVICMMTAVIIGYYALNRYYQKFTFLDIYSNGYKEVILLVKDGYSRFFGKA